MKTHSVNASDCLKSWATFLGVLADNVSTRKTSNGLRCKVVLPSGHNVVAVGEDSTGAVRNLLVELTRQMDSLPSCEHEAGEPVSCLDGNAAGQDQLRTQNTGRGKRMDAATKARRETIGVTTKTSLHLEIANLACERGVDTSVIARSLLTEGWDRFRTERRTDDPDRLLDRYEQLAISHTGSATKQWMVRVDRKLAIKIQLAAKEYERSYASIATCLIAEALRHELPALAHSPVAMGDASVIEDAIAQISSIRGPSARSLAREVGLGEHRVLMNQILSGAVITPVNVMKNVATALQIPLEVLSSALNECFQRQLVSSFKAQDGKPEVRIEPQSWKEAVTDLRLPAEEENRLLSLDQ